MSIKRIQLTDQGEILTCGIGVEHEEVEEFPPDFMGWHEECKREEGGGRVSGLLAIIKVSETYNVLHCHKCGLRVYFPVYVKTYGELKDYLDKQLHVHIGGLALDPQ